MKKLLLILCIGLSLINKNNLLSQIPNLVKDIYVGINQSNAGLSGIAYGSGILLNANDGIIGSELWFSDGSNAGTVLVKDMNSGASGSSPSGFTALGTKILFVATDATNGTELWITDGTLGGTTLVKDIEPSTGSSFPSNFMILGSKILFLATTATNGRELWITDGTTGGTTLVKDIWPGATTSAIVQMTNSGLGYVYFIANDGTAGEELWTSDGTTAGTFLLKDILPGSGYSNTQIFKMAGPNIYFSANDGVIGKELWKSDGTTSGTVLVKDIIPGATGTFSNSIIPECIAYNNKLFFIINEPANGTEIWESNGTTGGTIVNNITTSTLSTSFTSNLYIYNNDMYFFRTTFASGNNDTVWYYKITNNVTNTTIIKKYPGAYSTNANKFQFLQTNNTKFIAANSCGSSTSGIYFFVSDATAPGSYFAADSLYCLYLNQPNFTVPFISNNWIYPVAKANDYELMNINYTTGVNSQVKNINATNNFNNSIGSGSGWAFTNYFFNNRYYFLSDGGSTGLELYVTDGSSGGTNLLLDIYTGVNSGPVNPGNGDFKAIVTANNMFFYANDGFTGRELWAIGTGPLSVSEPKKLFDNIFVYPNPVNDNLYFNLSTEYFLKNRTNYFIYNSVGQLCSEGTLQENKMNVLGLADGFYTINLKSESGITTLKFVKN